MTPVTYILWGNFSLNHGWLWNPVTAHVARSTSPSIAMWHHCLLNVLIISHETEGGLYNNYFIQVMPCYVTVSHAKDDPYITNNYLNLKTCSITILKNNTITSFNCKNSPRWSTLCNEIVKIDSKEALTDGDNVFNYIKNVMKLDQNSLIFRKNLAESREIQNTWHVF